MLSLDDDALPAGPRALVIGTGRMARLRTRGLREAGLDVVICGRDLDRAQVAAEEWGGSALPYAEAAEQHYACVVITSASEDHRDDLERFLPVAPLVLCEKPVATDSGQARELDAEVKRLGHQLYVGFQRRFDPGIATLRARVEGGELGTLLHLRATDFDHRPGSRSFIEKSGGLFKDLVIHALDWVLWTTGSSLVSVYAAGSVMISPDYADVDDCDIATVSLILSDGALATINCARAHPLGQDVRVEILGSVDAVSVGLTPTTPLHTQEGLTDIGSAPVPQDFMDRFGAAFDTETREFARYVLGEKGSFGGCTMTEATVALIAAEACETSWRTGEIVRLDKL